MDKVHDFSNTSTSLTGVANWKGILSYQTIDDTTTDFGTTELIGIDSTIYVTPNVSTSVATIIGVKSAIVYQGQAALTAANVKGMCAKTTVSGAGLVYDSRGVDVVTEVTDTASVDSNAGVWVRTLNYSSNDITDNFGVRISRPDKVGTGDFINSYGIYLGNHSNAATTKNFAIYSEGGDVYPLVS